MAWRIKTVKIGGGIDYAKVADRIKFFWEENPNGKIDTEREDISENKVRFIARIWRDSKVILDLATVGTDINIVKLTANATASADAAKKGDKENEKLETVAVGRALAMLGYLASGEVASREEMEQFEAYKADLFKDEINKTIEEMKKAKTIDELRKLYVSLSAELRTNQEILNVKDKLKQVIREKRMKTIKFEKNSEEWLEFRKGKSGGSSFKDLYISKLPLIGEMKAKLDELQIEYPKTAKADELAALLGVENIVALKLNAEPKDRYYEIIAERVARPITPNDYMDRLNGMPFSMANRGHVLEPEAIEVFNEKTGKNANPECVVWVRDDNENIYISPDAVISEEEAVEVKCLESKKIIEAFLTKKYPQEYRMQIVKYFVVNEKLKKLYFVLYTDVIPGLELQIFEIRREGVMQQIEEARAFEDYIMRRIDDDTSKILELTF